jgi:hypothetical protein
MRQLYNIKDNNEGTRVIMDRLLSSIKAIEERNPYLNRFTDKEGISLLSSICCMLRVPKNIVGDYISDINNTLKVFGAEWMKEADDTDFVNGVMVKNSSYKETRRICSKQLSILAEMSKESS